MKLSGNNWNKIGDLLLLVETGEAWLVGHWTDEDYLNFLGLEDHGNDLATSTRQLHALSNLVEVK